ncbi:MAG: wax ester/triacylglycerol synthase family O-acyltransferase [Myxococcota bacterium]
MQQLNPQDAQFLYLETRNNLTHVTAVTIYDPSTAPGGQVRFKDIIAHVSSRLHTSQIFKRKLIRLPFELDHPYWVEDEYFDVEYHIQHGRLPEPGDWRQFCIQVARYHSRPLDMQRPLWEMFVIEGLDRIEGLPPGCYAIATKIHHAAIDGGAAVRFFGALNDLDPEGTPALPYAEPEPMPQQALSKRELVARAMTRNVKSPVKMLKKVVGSTPRIYRAAQRAVEMFDEMRSQKVPWTRFDVDVSPHKMYDATVFELSDLKRIKRMVPNATINDVVLAICSGGLRRFLMESEELPQESLIAWVPINARTAFDQDASGNQITAMTAALHTDIEDPIECLTAIRDTTRKTKEAKQGLSARLMTDLSQHVPAATQLVASRLVLQSALRPHVCNLFISNVPGPQVPLYMNGAKCVRSHALAPLAPGMGLFIATPSYNGMMTFNVVSTREILPDIARFMDALRSAFDALLSRTRTAVEEPEPA